MNIYLKLTGIIVLCLLSVLYIFDHFMFVNYGSIHSVKDASIQFKTLSELSATCKKEDQNLVLKIVRYPNGTAQARCETQLFAQTWEVTKLSNK